MSQILLLGYPPVSRYDKGVVRAWDISEALLEVDCHTVPEECLPRSKSNYDARRRFYRQVTFYGRAFQHCFIRMNEDGYICPTLDTGDVMEKLSRICLGQR